MRDEGGAGAGQGTTAGPPDLTAGPAPTPATAAEAEPPAGAVASGVARPRGTEREQVAPFGRSLAVFTLGAVLVSGQLYMVIPLLHDMATGWGSTTGALAWLVTAFAIGYGVGFLLFGPLSDRFGRRRLLMVGMPLAALTTALVAVSPGAEMAIVLRGLQGVAVATFPPAAMAYLAERLEPRRRAIAISAVTAAFLASAVLLQVGGQLMVGVTGWRGPFLVSAAGLVVAAVALGLVMLPDRARTEAGTTPRAGSLTAVYRALPGLLFDRLLLPRYVATVLVMTGFVAVYTGLQVYGVAGSAQEMLALRASGLPMIVMIPLLMPWLGRIPAPARAAAFLVLGAAALVAVGLTHVGVVGVAALLAVYVAAIAGGLPGLNEAISAGAGAARGSALALFSFGLALGSAVGPQLVGLFPGFGALMYGVAALLVAGALAVLVSARMARRPS
ncbi:MFS transporter [Nonomuraea sp. NBC_01738]|uniref:MFS transporter n=1 Tax=Nonomuraea sp. NBC_01738 TaxID=2976003 RepID=UPI002E0D7F9F|nr:MFS transporter [Nonomuraea sp. NBC_01738]